MTKNLQRKIKNTGLVLSLAFGFLMLSGVTAKAQYNNDDYYRRQRQEQRDNRDYGNNGYNNVYRMAQQNGYNDGLRKGMQDAREGHNNPTGTSEYKHATNGYSSSYGNKEGYKQAYRQAFLQGFSEGQNRAYNNGRYGNRNRTYNNSGNILRRVIRGY